MLKAARDVIIVRIVYASKMGGIHIPDQSKKALCDFHGEVVSIGDDCPFKNDLKIGDTVKFWRHEGVPVDFEGERLWALKSEYVVAKEAMCR